METQRSFIINEPRESCCRFSLSLIHCSVMHRTKRCLYATAPACSTSPPVAAMDLEYRLLKRFRIAPDCTTLPQSYRITLGAHAQLGLQYLVCVCVCVCVSALICRLTHWIHKREIPTDSSQYRNNVKNSDFCKNVSFKSYGVIC